MPHRFLRAVARLVAVILATSSILIPGEAAAAAWAEHAARSTVWMPIRASNITTVDVPRDNWTPIAEMDYSGRTGSDIRMIDGERWITLGRDEAGRLGLSGDQVSDLLLRAPSVGAIVFARYSPENAELRISMVKVERGFDGKIRTYLGDYTPHHGESFKAYRNYLTADEKHDVYRAGYNPFEPFKGDRRDPIFHDINWAGAQVAVGHAMRANRAVVAFIAVPQTRFAQSQSCSGGLLRKKCTYTVDGYAKPRWFVALPEKLQPNGTAAQICVVRFADGSCDDIEHVATSGVTVAEWSGGNMPAAEDLLYHWETTKKSWTVLAFAVFTGVLFGLGWAGGLNSLFGAATAEGVATGVTAVQAGAIAGATYGIGSTVLGSGGSLTQAQSGWLGSTGDGSMARPDAGGEHGAGLAAAIHERHIVAPENAGLTGAVQLYKGNCAEGYTVQQCRDAGLDPGNIPRPDSYAEYNHVLATQEAYARCYALGYRDEALRQCAAPNGEAFGPTVPR